jgi:hypothetical protein
LRGDQTWNAIPTQVAGSDTYVQYNNSGAFAATSGLVFNYSTNTLTATNIAGAGAGITSLNASNLSSGTVGTARLGSGTASTSAFLRGDSSWSNTLALGSITTSTQALSITGTFNGSGTTFTAPLLVNITNSASNAASKLFDVQLSGASAFNVGVGGTVYFPNPSIPFAHVFGGTNTPSTGTNLCPWNYVAYAATAVRLTLSSLVAPTGNFTITIMRSSNGGATFPDTIATVTVASGNFYATTTTITTSSLNAGDLLQLNISAVNGASTWTAKLLTLTQNQ